VRHCITAIIALFGVCAATTAAAETPQKRTYAVVVANNGSVDPGVDPLRYADDDGARFYELFGSFADEAHLLTTLDEDSQRVFPKLASQTKAPTSENLKTRVAAIAADIEAQKKAGVETEVYLVFTGHGNVDEGGEGYLSLADGKLRRSDLQRDVIRPLNADYTHLIIDACHAYFMVRSRGGNEEWEDDRSGETLDDAFGAYLEGRTEEQATTSTVGVILSTAGTAEVHEWSKFRGGVFSHELRSGMLGAADANADGDVTYRELEAYLVAANVAVTNPRARIKVFAEPPAQDRSRPITTLDGFRDASRLVIPKGIGGRYHLEDARGLRYADMHVDPSSETSVVLLREPVDGRDYHLRTDVAQARVALKEDAVRSPQLAFVERKEQSRGSVEESFRTSLFATPFGPAFVNGYVAGRESLESTKTAAAPTVSAESKWSREFTLDYAVGTPPFRVGGVQHHVGFGLDFMHNRVLGIGPFLGYGFADTPVGQFHRVSGGVQLTRFVQADAWRFGPRLRLGHQGVFFDGEDGVAADPLGLRGEAAIMASRALLSGLDLTVLGGASVDVTTQTDGSASAEQVILNPFVGVGTRF
jgi:hypothetical protein